MSPAQRSEPGLHLISIILYFHCRWYCRHRFYLTSLSLLFYTRISIFLYPSNPIVNKAAQAKASKSRERDHDRDKLELWVVKLTGPGNYQMWKNQMKNFLRMKEGLLKLVKNEFVEPTEPTILNTFKDDQLAFENHLVGEIWRLPPARELDMRFKTY